MPRRWLSLIFIGSVIAVIWLGWLPSLAKSQTIREREAFLEDKRIDPAAMFYTELPCLEGDGFEKSTDTGDLEK